MSTICLFLLSLHQSLLILALACPCSAQLSSSSRSWDLPVYLDSYGLLIYRVCLRENLENLFSELHLNVGRECATHALDEANGHLVDYH